MIFFCLLACACLAGCAAHIYRLADERRVIDATLAQYQSCFRGGAFPKTVGIRDSDGPCDYFEIRRADRPH